MTRTIPTLRTRQPSGVPPLPLMLVEGAPKSGKSYLSARLTADPRILESYWIDLGEAAADQYGSIGRYSIIEHSGGYSDILGQIDAVTALPGRVDGKARVLVIDSISALWAMLVEAAGQAAKQRQRRKGKAVSDDTEVKPTFGDWGDAKLRWRRVIDALIEWDGLVVLLARGREVSVVDDRGEPTKEKEWKVESEKSLPYDVDVWLRLTGVGQAQVIGARTVHMELPTNGTPIAVTSDLAELVFDVLACDPSTAGTRQLAVPNADEMDRVEAVTQLIAIVGKARAGAMWAEAGLPGKDDGVAFVLRSEIAALCEAARAEVLDAEAAAAADDAAEQVKS